MCCRPLRRSAVCVFKSLHHLWSPPIASSSKCLARCNKNTVSLRSRTACLRCWGGFVAGVPPDQRVGLPPGYRWHQVFGMPSRLGSSGSNSVMARLALHFPQFVADGGSFATDKAKLSHILNALETASWVKRVSVCAGTVRLILPAPVVCEVFSPAVAVAEFSAHLRGPRLG